MLCPHLKQEKKRKESCAVGRSWAALQPLLTYIFMVWLCLWFKIFANPHGTTNSCIFPYRVFVLKKKKSILFLFSPSSFSFPHYNSFSLKSLMPLGQADCRQSYDLTFLLMFFFVFFSSQSLQSCQLQPLQMESLIAQIPFPPMMMESIDLSLW